MIVHILGSIMPSREAEEEKRIIEERRTIVQSHITWVLLFLTFLVGLIGLLPHLRVYNDIRLFVLTIPLCLVYLGFAAGAAYFLVRLSIGSALLLKWRKQMKQISPKTYRKLNLPPWYEKIFVSPWYEKVLFDKNKKLREPLINVSRVIIFIFWLLIMIGELLTPT